MPKMHRFKETAYKNGFPEFLKGEAYAPTEVTAVYVATGVAEEVALEAKPEESAATTPAAKGKGKGKGKAKAGA